MTDDEYIREAVSQADGWRYWGNDNFVVKGVEIHAPTWVIKDALAAQLVRQVDATEYRLDVGPKGTVLYEPQGDMFESPGLDPDRTMNTLRAIVDSGVLS